MHLCAEPGATLEGISDMIPLATSMTQNTQVENVVIALGVNDLRDHGSVGTTNARFSKAIDTVKINFPQSNIFVSAIIPRKSNKGNAKAHNEKVKDINGYLKLIATEENCITYIGNANTFKDSDPKGLYDPKDITGTHIAKAGKDILVKLIESVIKKSSSGKKRPRSVLSTPPSVKKDTKSRKCSSGDD